MDGKSGWVGEQRTRDGKAKGIGVCSEQAFEDGGFSGA